MPSDSSLPPPMTSSTADYHAYLLRLWRETVDGPWRISLQEGASSERLGFPDLETLVSYLHHVMRQEQKGGSEKASG